MYLKNKKGSIHSWETWLGIATMAVLNLEIGKTPLEYLNEKIHNGHLTEVADASDDDIKKANYKILYMAKLLGNYYGVDSEVEIQDMNLKIYPVGRVSSDVLNNFKKKLEEYKQKVYSAFEL